MPDQPSTRARTSNRQPAMPLPIPFPSKTSHKVSKEDKWPPLQCLAADAQFSSSSSWSRHSYQSANRDSCLYHHSNSQRVNTIEGFLDYASSLPRPTRVELARMDEHAGGEGSMSNAYLSPLPSLSSPFHSHIQPRFDNYHSSTQAPSASGGTEPINGRRGGEHYQHDDHRGEDRKAARHSQKKGEAAGQVEGRQREREELRDCVKSYRNPLPESPASAWADQWKSDFGFYPAESGIDTFRRCSQVSDS